MGNKDTNKKFNLGDILRDRGSLFGDEFDEDDIGEIWKEQKRMQAEDRKLERDLKAAKKKARELKRELYKNKIGESSTRAAENISKYLNNTKEYLKNIHSWSMKNKKYSVLVVAVLLIGPLLLVFKSTESDPQTLADTKVVYTDQDLTRETPNFSLLYKCGTSSEEYDVVRISPPGNEPSYTYLDRFSEESPTIQVTQQKVPVDFDLEKTATNFQATDIIQINDYKVYHGFNEKVNVQSLVFIKDEILIFIRSPQKFSDNQWVNYISSLI